MKVEISNRANGFAIVQRSSIKEQLPQMVWHSIGQATQGYRLPGTPNLYFIGPTDNQEGGSHQSFLDAPSSVRGPLLRAVERQRCLMRLIHAGEPSSNPACIYEMTDQLGNRQVKVYTELPLGGGGTFAHIKGAERLSVKRPDVRQVNIISGTCLFGRQALHFVADCGVFSLADLRSPGVLSSKIRVIRTGQTFSLYEIEGAIRLMGVVNNLIRAFPSHMSVTVTFDVPRVDYYLYLLEAWGRNLVSRELMLEWFQIVDNRSASVTSLLHRKLFDNSRARVSVRNSSALGELERYVKSSVVDGCVPELSSLMAILEQNDRVWSLALDAQRPRDFIGLAHMSYVVEELRASLSEGQIQLGIFVENPSEFRIFDEATKFAKSIRKNCPGLEFPMLGIYPLENIILFDDNHPSRSNLYHYDHNTTNVVGTSGDVVDLLDVAESFYGEEL